MYERKIPNHEGADALIVSKTSEISRKHSNVIYLVSYATDVLRVELNSDNGFDVYVLNQKLWSITIRKHISWFIKYLNEQLNTNLCYYDVKSIAILNQLDWNWLSKYSDYYEDWLNNSEYMFHLFYSYDEINTRYYNNVSGEIVMFDAAPNEWAKNKRLEVEGQFQIKRKVRV